MTYWGWVSRQLDKTDPLVGSNVTGLLREFKEYCSDLTDDQKRDVLDKFHKLALGHVLIEATPGERWGPVVPGEYRIGDTVRVKGDAYSEQLGTLHNGRRGRVTAAHGPSCAVLYDGEKNTELQYNHKLDVLERLVL